MIGSAYYSDACPVKLVNVHPGQAEATLLTRVAGLPDPALGDHTARFVKIPNMPSLFIHLGNLKSRPYMNFCRENDP